MHRARGVSGKACESGSFSNIDLQILLFEGDVAARQIIEKACLSVIQVRSARRRSWISTRQKQ
ncbi:hypothetical protein B5K06_33255 [Rhizobium grahamii]|uniref:Uncharacterized protein n=1 Tax=Rhizobium grahamii TaxID=1120045 RepID=A0A370KE23_9HYPH|nr:hypothetical protein B5K06_33255 [Rhizobium grahamii]